MVRHIMDNLGRWPLHPGLGAMAVPLPVKAQSVRYDRILGYQFMVAILSNSSALSIPWTQNRRWICVRHPWPSGIARIHRVLFPNTISWTRNPHDTTSRGMHRFRRLAVLRTWGYTRVAFTVADLLASLVCRSNLRIPILLAGHLILRCTTT